MSYKIIIDSKNEISLPHLKNLEPTNIHFENHVVSGKSSDFSLCPKKKHPRPTNPNHQRYKRLFQGAHRLQHHGLAEGLDGVFWGMGRSLMEAED